MTSTEARPVAPARQRVRLVLLIALFLVPLVAAWVLVGQWRPQGRSEHGELLVPARPLPAFAAEPAPGQPLPANTLGGRWTLVYVATGPDCEASCRGALYRIRQVRLATGRDIDRVQRLALWQRAPDAATREWLAREHAGLVDAVAATPAVQAFTDVWPAAGQPGAWIYLVDPLGNLVLRYPADVDAKGILSDLGRLLKLSKIG